VAKPDFLKKKIVALEARSKGQLYDHMKFYKILSVNAQWYLMVRYAYHFAKLKSGYRVMNEEVKEHVFFKKIVFPIETSKGQIWSKISTFF